MSVPDRSIDPRLLSAAKEEFLQKGFKDASLAEICKAAGVTTGALYKRYEGKEALFSALVSDTVREMEEFATGFEDTDISHLTDQELYDSLCMTPESITEWMKSLYEHREAVTLLVRCAAGTRFENYRHDWAERMNVLDYKYYLEARRRGIAEEELTQEEMHVLTPALWTLYYEPFYHDFTWEQMERLAQHIHAFVNWPKVMGIRDSKNT